MKIIRCPHCQSEKVDFITTNLCKCPKCGCSFKLDPQDDSEGEPVEDLPNATQPQLFKDDTENRYKVCPDCGIKIPINARECPVCGYRTLGGSIAIAGRGCLHRIVLQIIVIGICIFLIYTLFEIWI